jgi:hypothetical protein
MNIIPIEEGTLDLVEKLNNGNRPELKGDLETFFIYNGKDLPHEIVDVDEMVERFGDLKGTKVTVFCRDI